LCLNGGVNGTLARAGSERSSERTLAQRRVEAMDGRVIDLWGAVGGEHVLITEDIPATGS
jgi:hypothetical protein